MRIWLPKSLQNRLVLSHILVALLGLLLLSVYSVQILSNAAHQQLEQSYSDLASALAADLVLPLSRLSTGQGSPAELGTLLRDRLAYLPGAVFTVFLPSGEPAVDSSGKLPEPVTAASQPRLWELLQGNSPESRLANWVAPERVTLNLAVRVVEQSGRVLGVLSLGVPLEEQLALARRSQAILVIAAVLVAAGISVVGYWLARNLSWPIENLAQMAEGLARGDLGSREPTTDDPQEVHRLAQAFNNMAARLQEHVEELVSFVANASHELRTPLTSIKLRVEALRNGALDDPPVTDQFLAEIESEVDRLSTMVNDLLDLSRLEAGMDSDERTPLNLVTVAYEVCETFRVRAQRAGVEMQCNSDPNLPLTLGSEDQLRRMLNNLVDNALKYSMRGGRVTITLQSVKGGKALCLMVEDTGFGISEEHLPHIFERFYRVEATRPRFGPPQGSGLGLAIAKSIAEAHGGTIWVTSRLGEGSTFWVELPAVEMIELEAA